MKINKLLLLLLTACIVEANVETQTSSTLLTAEFQGSEGNQEATIDTLIKKIDTIGFSTVAVNKNIQTHYYNKFYEKNVEVLSFFSMLNKEKLRPLLLANPDFGAFAPFNFLVYKTLDNKHDNITWYGHLAPETMLNIIGEKNIENKKAFKEMLYTLDTLVKKELNPSVTKRFEHTKPLPQNGLIKFIKTFDKPDDMETFIEDFISDHDGRFATNGFVIAGFIDLEFEYSDMELDFDKYDAYWVSLLCHFTFSNTIFNRGMPEAAMFAPCSVYFYIPKGTNELHVGYASVDNWVNALHFRDKERIDYMKSIDTKVAKTFEEMGFTKVVQKREVALKKENHKVEKTKEKIDQSISVKAKLLTKEEKTKPAKNENKQKQNVVEKLAQKEFKTAKVNIGATVPEKQSAYYAAQPQKLANVKAALEKNGFNILAQTEILKGHTVLSITNPQLQATNTYVAVLNLHLNGTEEIRVQNPSYFGAAYLGDKYKSGQFTNTLQALKSSLGELYEVEDTYKSDDLGEYQFMMGMPEFDDMIEIAEGDKLETYLRSDKTSKSIAYILKLPNNALLVGHKLKKETNTFLSKIAVERNVNLLPYQSLIKDKKAVLLDPKYYLALSLPLLSMSDFMKISSVPRAIEKEIEQAYK